MYRILIVLFLVSNFLFAKVDANLKIIKEVSVIPKIVINIAGDSEEKIVLKKISSLLKKDLKISGHFEIVKSEDKVLYNDAPDMLSLSNSGKDLYINLYAQRLENKKYSFSFKIYDLNLKKLLLEKVISTSDEGRFPFLAHRAAISINDYFKAPSIAWMDKFVILSAYKESGKADIVIADYTLTFKRTIVSGGLNIFPKWADKEQKNIYFTSYNYKKPTLVKLNIYTREKKVIMQSEGMIVCSDVSKDGLKLLITAAPKNQPDVFLYDTISKKTTKITSYSGIDVNAQFLENESKIVFVSDRLGRPNIFAKRIGSSAVERLVFHSNNNSSATAFNDYIVFSSKDTDTSIREKRFNLYLISTKTSDIKQLTLSGINQFPKFSSDGESLLFLKTYKGVSSLGIIRLKFGKSYLFRLSSGKIQSIDW